MKHDVMCWVVGLLALAPAARAEVPFNIIVAEEMTDAGRKIVRPSPERPAYYLGVFRGYADQGKENGEGDPEAASLPAPEQVRRLVTQTLASQGYLPAVIPASANSKAVGVKASAAVMVAPPSLFINVYWGFINHSSLPIQVQLIFPISNGKSVEMEQFDAPPSPEMLDLIGAKHWYSQPFGYSQTASPSRYYVILDAYDYATYATSRKRLRLWRTKMSVPAFDLTLAQTLEPMLQAGSLALGKDIYQPLTIAATLVPPGKVLVGKPVVVGQKP